MAFPLAIPLLTAGLKFLGGLGKGKAAGREKEAELIRQQNAQALQAAQFNRSAPAARGAASAYGDVLAGLQPVGFTGRGRNLRISGGLSPSLLSQNTRQIGQGISRQALMASLGQGTDPYSFQPTPAPKAGILDKILGFGGIAGEILPFLSNRRSQPNAVPVATKPWGKVRF